MDAVEAWCRGRGCIGIDALGAARQPRDEELLRDLRSGRTRHRACIAPSTVTDASRARVSVQSHVGVTICCSCVAAPIPDGDSGRCRAAASSQGRRSPTRLSASSARRRASRGRAAAFVGWVERIGVDSPLRDPRLRGRGRGGRAHRRRRRRRGSVGADQLARRPRPRGRARGLPPRPRRDRAGGRAQRPFQFGGRFSANAASPSRRSSELMIFAIAPCRSSSSASRRLRSRPRARPCGSRAPPSAPTGRSARRARSRCRADCSGSHSRLTRPSS